MKSSVGSIAKVTHDDAGNHINNLFIQMEPSCAATHTIMNKIILHMLVPSPFLKKFIQ